MALGWTGDPEDFFGVGSALSMLSQNLQNFKTHDFFATNVENAPNASALEPIPALSGENMETAGEAATSEQRQENQHRPKANSFLGFLDDEQLKQGLGAMFDFFTGKPAEKQETGEGSTEKTHGSNVDERTVALVGPVEETPFIGQPASTGIEVITKQGTLDELKPLSPLKDSRKLVQMDEERNFSSRSDVFLEPKDEEKIDNGKEPGEAQEKEDKTVTAAGTAKSDASQDSMRPSHVDKKSSFDTDVERTSQLYGGLQLIDWNGRCMPFNSKRLMR